MHFRFFLARSLFLNFCLSMFSYVLLRVLCKSGHWSVCTVHLLIMSDVVCTMNIGCYRIAKQLIANTPYLFRRHPLLRLLIVDITEWCVFEIRYFILLKDDRILLSSKTVKNIIEE